MRETISQGYVSSERLPAMSKSCPAFTRPAAWKDGLDTIRRIQGFPRVLFLLYSSFVPPLLKILDAPNFIVDLAGRTTTGKTITLRVAASVWGNPDERAGNGLIVSWDNTRVYVERASSVQCDLPIILDDSKRVKRTKRYLRRALHRGQRSRPWSRQCYELGRDLNLANRVD